MRTLEIIRDGAALCIAGGENASLLTATLSLFVEEPHQGTLRVSGMNELDGGRSSHTYWLDEEVVVPGQSLSICFSEREDATAPTTEVATDSEGYIAEQQWYQGELAKCPLQPRLVDRKWPDGSLVICVPGVCQVEATFEGEREFITLSLSWNRWRPDVCRYTLSSFSQAEAVARAGTKDWLQGRLQLGEACQVRLGT